MPLRGLVRRVADAYARLLSTLLAISVLILVFPVTLQVVSRQTSLLPHYIWTEEMARFLLVWTIMIGAIVGQREGIHFIVDLWPRLTGRFRAFMDLVSGVFVLSFGAVFLWFGIEFVDFAWFRISELAELPLWLIHLAWPILGFSWLIFGGEKFVADLRVLIHGEAA
ncbi:TRAP transporter small permease [Roseomonas fluvialis]|uniref:TRAP transporter small permease protein n=1 Tax=Roseomonas fluvialis TaxID=1750527 RepID=A0ABN6P3E9_9PROT|nr:TRAP transporter small permease subunit [Roseomonas fluvialis]BDG72402.1 C4-dicarboxylate ABC transporter permease [Roseomonas fluvialis]